MLNDPEDTIDDGEVEIIDLDAPAGAGHGPGRPLPLRRPLFSPSRARIRTWMSVLLVISTVLLLVWGLASLPHPPGKTASIPTTTPQDYKPLSLSVANGIAYASSPDGTLEALRLGSGSLLWRHTLKEVNAVADPPGFGEETTLVAGGALYVAALTLDYDKDTLNITLDAFRAGNGSLLWTRTIPTYSPPPTEQLAVAGGVVYISSEVDTIEALRASDGSLLWYYTSRSPFTVAPSVVDGVVYLLTVDGHISALRASDGSLLWTHTSPFSLSSVLPAVENGIIYIMREDGTLDALHTKDGSLLWQYTPGSPFVDLSPQVGDGAVYAIALDGSVYALRAADGSLLWHDSLHVFTVAPTMNIAGEVVYVGIQDGSIDALRAGDGSLLWRFNDGMRSTPAVTITNGVAYIISAGDTGRITALKAADGSLLWQAISPVPPVLFPQLALVVSHGLVLIALEDGSLDAFEAGNGALAWHIPRE